MVPLRLVAGENRVRQKDSNQTLVDVDFDEVRMPRLLSVNVGLPRDVTWNGKTVRTSVWKLPVTGRRMVNEPADVALVVLEKREVNHAF
jgi:hypothetical protein